MTKQSPPSEYRYMRYDREGLEARCARLEEALRIIAGEQQCTDNLMSDKDVARAALSDTVQRQTRAAGFRDGYMVALKDRSPDGPNAAEEMRERAARLLWEPDQEMVDDLAAAVITMPADPPKSPHRIARTVLRAAVTHVRALPIDPETGGA